MTSNGSDLGAIGSGGSGASASHGAVSAVTLGSTPLALAAAGMLAVLAMRGNTASSSSPGLSEEVDNQESESPVYLRSLAEDLWGPPITAAELSAALEPGGADAMNANLRSSQWDETERTRIQLTFCAIAGVGFLALHAKGHINAGDPMVVVVALGLLPMTWASSGLIYDRLYPMQSPR